MFPQIFGKYVLERELAAGGMAKVYLATLRGAVGFEKRLVVKQIRPELASDPAFVRRFVEEAKVAVELSHANIVPVYELGVEQGVYYIAMELCGGLTLAEVLAASGTLSAEEGAYLGSEVCRALDYAHRRAGIVHRDVTPRNVLIDEEGAVRLIDFGIAAPVAVTRGDRSEVFGSPGHMPPEQLTGGPLTPAADVFAVAALLVEVWTGRPPFRRASARASEQALSAPVPRVDAAEPALSPLAEHVARALSLDPEQRPAQAELFARPLRDFLRSVDSVDVARRLGERVRRTQRRSRTSDVPNVTPAPSSAAPSGRPSQSFTTGLPTQTFAAREEVVEWTRRLDSQPPEPEPADSPPVAELALRGGTAEHAPERTARLTRGALLRTGAAATALSLAIVAALELVRQPDAEPPRSASAPARAAPSTGPPAASPAPGVSVALPAPASLGAAPASLGAAPASLGAAPASLGAAPARAVASARAALNASLRLTADPPAHVSIDGSGVSRSFETPVRELKLPAGSYSVTFRSAIYSTPLNTRVLLTGGAQRSVHADFRDAEPRVTVR